MMASADTMWSSGMRMTPQSCPELARALYTFMGKSPDGGCSEERCPVSQAAL